jgi:hypothetical protein
MVTNNNIRKLMNDIEDFCEFNQNRIDKIRPYILNYFNSLHSSGDSSVEILNKVMFTLEHRLKVTEDILTHGSYEDKKRALKKLTAPISLKVNEEFGKTNNNYYYSDEDDDDDENNKNNSSSDHIAFEEWENTVEELFQNVGKKIAIASKNVSGYRLSNKKKKDTIFTLMEAGIKGLENL